MGTFDCIFELLEFLRAVSGSVSIVWIRRRVTLSEDRRGFHWRFAADPAARRVAKEMHAQYLEKL